MRGRAVSTFASQILTRTILSQVSQAVGAYTAHNKPADVVEYQNLRKASGEYLVPIVNHPQNVARNSPNLRRVVPDEMETRPKNACELQFSSLHSTIGNIPQHQPKYSDKASAQSDSRLAHSRLLFPGE
jgi:hypothetical protein